MSEQTPVVNMAILANAAELTRNVVASMMTADAVKNLFGQPAGRENVYNVVMMAVNKRLAAQLAVLPTGQFNKSVQNGRPSSRGQTNPNETQ